MKKGAFIVIFFLMLPVVFSEVSISQDKDVYGLGDKILVIAFAIEEEDVDGFFKASIDCTNYMMQYFVTPISLENGFRVSIEVPELTATKGMVGNCKIEAILEGSNGTVDTGYTGEFEIKNELEISCENVKAVPGESVEVLCSVKKFSGELLDRGTVKVNYRKKDFSESVKDGMFSFSIYIEDNTPAGIQKVAIEAEDSKGSYGELIFEVSIGAVPTELENRVNKESLEPGEILEIRPVLYDHIADLINATISLELIDSRGKKLISKEIVSGESISYSVDSSSVAGEYKIISHSEGLEAERTVTVESLSKLEITYDNEKVIVKNVGNIVYNGRTTIMLKGGDVNHVIDNNLKLKPGGTKEIDLSREVPYGNYDIVLPQSDGGERVIEGVEIQDNRPIYKKAGENVRGGLGAVTGAVAKTVGFVSTRPFFAGVILLVIILSIVLFYSKDVIKNSLGKVKIEVNKEEGIHVKEKEDTEGLFKDFKYGKE